MRRPPVISRVRGLAAPAVCLAACLCAAVEHAHAQRLPVRCYGETEGLVQGSVTVALQDRRGFLWIGTNEGLSRFDGYRFVNYGIADGLRHGYITGIAEDGRGRIWVTTIGGLARFMEDATDPGAPASSRNNSSGAQRGRRLRGYPLPSASRAADVINGITFDRQGTLWTATNDGLYRGDLDEAGEPRFQPAGFEGQHVTAVFEDRRGRLWFRVRDRGLFVYVEGRTITYDEPIGIATGYLSALAFDEDRHGTLRVAMGSQVFQLDEGAGERIGRWTPVRVDRPSEHSFVAIRSDSSDRLWVGTTFGLLLRENGHWRTISTAHGLGAGRLSPLIEDRDGNLWVAAQAGLCRISREPLISYTVADGLPHPIVLGVFEGADGRIYVNTPGGFAEIDGDRVVLVPGSNVSPIRTLERRLFRARSGDWWVVLDDALIRFRGPPLQFRDPVQRIPAALISPQGFAEPGTVRTPGMYEDPSGRLLVATKDNRLHWIDPTSLPVVEPIASGGTHGDVLLLPGLADRAGSIWLSSMEGLARLRNGRVERVAATSGLPETTIRSLHVDGRGRLWVGLRTGGVSMVRDPAADTLEFVNYSTRTGLSSDTVWSITDDELGRIYLATNRGLDRLDPATGRVRHFTIADGLPSNYATYCLRDTRGYIWVGTINGLARLDPRAERVTPGPPPVYLTRIQVAGEEISVPETGSAQVAIPRLPSSRNQVSIEYVGVSLGREHAFRYQYRLEGVSPEWSEPTDQRVITYAQLAPGHFRFEARAIDWDGATSPQPAVVVLEILPPFWRRWWFLAAAVALVMTSALMLHRVRLRHALAMERIRRQVATDLHDDIGSGLSQIAILSEVAKRDRSRPHLDAIAGLARGMRESMDDIVWAVDPRADRLVNLVERIRQVAFNSLESDGMEVDLRMPAERDLERVNLGAGMRRHVLLVAKEAITNIARHAAASRVEITLELAGRHLRLTIRDNGRGFIPARASDGQGLRSLSRRATELGGQIEIDSSPGLGTRISVGVPIR